MTGPAHSVETSYEPHRNLITGVVNRAKPGGARSPLPASPDAAPAADSEPSTKHEEPRTLSSYHYANDLLGRRETISQGGEAFGMLALGENRVEVAYNDRSEVVGAKHQGGSGVPPLEFAYAYDAIGNRKRSASEVGDRKSEVSYEVNALNQYAAIDERNSSNPKSAIRNPQFDLDGNLTEDARHRYTWNADNNLVRVEAKDGTSRLDYLYDHQSRRTVRIETRQPGTKNEEQRTTYYLYDDWNLLAEIDAVPAGGELGTLNFEPATLFSWGRDLSGSLQGAGGVGGLLAISKVNPDEGKPDGAQLETLNLKLETLFPTYDANGNIGQLIDNDGAIVAAYAYDPFGNVTEMAGAEAAGNPWRFSTKPVEAGTEWLYYGFRYYNPETGRWPSRDPIWEQGGMNLYGFVGNQPIGKVDFLGMVSYADYAPSFQGAFSSTGALSGGGIDYYPVNYAEGMVGYMYIFYQGGGRATPFSANDRMYLDDTGLVESLMRHTRNEYFERDIMGDVQGDARQFIQENERPGKFHGGRDSFLAVAWAGEGTLQLTLQSYTMSWECECSVGCPENSANKLDSPLSCEFRFEVVDKYDFAKNPGAHWIGYITEYTVGVGGTPYWALAKWGGTGNGTINDGIKKSKFIQYK